VTQRVTNQTGLDAPELIENIILKPQPICRFCVELVRIQREQ
jgi:hypothetical protein